MKKRFYPQEPINCQISKSTFALYKKHVLSRYCFITIDPNSIIIFASSCLVIFEGEEVVTAEKKTKKNDEECEKFEGATVCVQKYEDRKLGTFACQLSIEDMNEDLVGK